MEINLYGQLSDPQVQQSLKKAQESPERWTVYLVRENGARRSEAQNKMYRRLVRKLAQQLGKDVKYWEDFLVERFLGFDEVLTDEGYLRRVLVSTGTLNVEEFSTFLNACLVFAAENQVK